MIFYILDASVLIPFYFKPPTVTAQSSSSERYEFTRVNRINESLNYVIAQWVVGSAILVVPNFIIAEVLNAFAYRHFRDSRKSMQDAQKEYDKLKRSFLDCVRYSGSHKSSDRKRLKRFLFNYELNRHHLLALDRVMPIEHTTDPLEKNLNASSGHSALSPFDLLLISVAVELETLLGEGRVCLLTAERRMCLVCSNGDLPKCYQIDKIKNPEKELPQIVQEEKICMPEFKI